MLSTAKSVSDIAQDDLEHLFGRHTLLAGDQANIHGKEDVDLVAVRVELMIIGSYALRGMVEPREHYGVDGVLLAPSSRCGPCRPGDPASSTLT